LRLRHQHHLALSGTPCTPGTGQLKQLKEEGRQAKGWESLRLYAAGGAAAQFAAGRLPKAPLLAGQANAPRAKKKGLGHLQRRAKLGLSVTPLAVISRPRMRFLGRSWARTIITPTPPRLRHHERRRARHLAHRFGAFDRGSTAIRRANRRTITTPAEAPGPWPMPSPPSSPALQ